MIRLSFLLLFFATTAQSEALVAARTIAPNSIIAADDLVLKNVNVFGSETDKELFVGMEARVALYAGRPVRAADVRAPAIVERNAIITLIYSNAGITIRTEGRSLSRAGPGERIRVMNLSSRSTVSATLGGDGAAYVSGGNG